MIRILFLLFAVPVYATVLQEGQETLKSELKYKILAVDAKCRPPRFEDDAFTVFYSAPSYQILKPYLESRYSVKLLGRTCGGNHSSTELSADRFEAVKILVINIEPLKQDIKRQIDDVLKRY